MEIPLTHDERLRDYVFTPEPVARADFFVNCPKFKAHPWTTVTFSIKNYIGIQDDRHRLIDHDHKLNEKIARSPVHHPAAVHRDRRDHRRRGPDADADAVRPRPHHHGQQPGRVRRGVLRDHRGRSAQRRSPPAQPTSAGSAPLDLEGSRSPATSPSRRPSARAKGFKVGLIRVEKYFEGTHITRVRRPAARVRAERLLLGRLPGRDRGGDRDPPRLRQGQTDEQMPRLHVVFGAYDGQIDGEARARRSSSSATARPGRASSHGKPVEIREPVQGRARRTIRTPRGTQDIFAKLASDQGQARRRGDPARGLPGLGRRAGARAGQHRQPQEPVLRSEEHGDLRSRVLRMEGPGHDQQAAAQAYQQNGAFAERGEAAPELEP